MEKFKTQGSDYKEITVGQGKVSILKKEKFDSFNESTLGLGDLSIDSKPINALAVIFDLAGFTNFCKQIDPHLVVPDFLNNFLRWLYSKVREVMAAESYDDGYEMWGDLPFYSKFLGDGILFIWDTDTMDADHMCNIIIGMKEICDSYEHEFLEKYADRYSEPPNKLRCGISRGIIYSVGEGNDFVGPCINMAARLQKLGPLSFCFSRRGIDYENAMHDDWKTDFVTIKCEVRGIGPEERICILKKEFDKLEPTLKTQFKKIK